MIFVGNGAQKAHEVITQSNDWFIDGVKPVAVDMMVLAEKAFRERKFMDVAYSTPLHLKEFQATVPKKNIL